MKFGKHLKAAVVAGWVYLDYKALKQLLKQLQAKAPTGTDGRREEAERQFMDELWNGIANVNSFFIDKENGLLAELQQRTNEELDCSALYEQVQDLRSHAILNYLAVLKIAKKHDKHSDAPLRQKAVDHMWGQAFYLSLEHSYLFAECKQHLQHAAIDAKLVSYAEMEVEKLERAESPGLRSALAAAGVGGELEVPAHFERCLRTGEREPLYEDAPGVRASDQSLVNLEISRILRLAGARSRSSDYSFPASPTPTRIVSALGGGAPPAHAAAPMAAASRLASFPAAAAAPAGAGAAPEAAAPLSAARTRDARAVRVRRSRVNALEQDAMFDMSEFDSACETE